MPKMQQRRLVQGRGAWLAQTQGVLTLFVGTQTDLANIWVNDSNIAGFPKAQISLGQMFSTIEMANMSNNTCRVKAYWLIPREATSQDPEAAWNTGIADQNITTGAGFQTPTKNTIGTGPTMSPEFNRTWRIQKIKKLTLGAGGHYRTALVNSAKRKMVSKTNVLAAESYDPKWCRALMFVFSGTLIVDSTVSTAVNWGPGNIAYIQQQNFKYRRIETTIPQLVWSSDATAITAANQRIMNIEEDVVATVATA